MPTEATFILAGLLILIAVGGWAFGQFLDRDRDGQLPTRISADYIRGLNLVLSRKTDEALELFIQMAKVDDETLETHFALGHLFRRRGEVERAIRVHQNLLARPNLNDMQHDQAVFALGEDYLGAPRSSSASWPTARRMLRRRSRGSSISMSARVSGSRPSIPSAAWKSCPVTSRPRWRTTTASSQRKH